MIGMLHASDATYRVDAGSGRWAIGVDWLCSSVEQTDEGDTAGVGRRRQMGRRVRAARNRWVGRPLLHWSK